MSDFISDPYYAIKKIPRQRNPFSQFEDYCLDLIFKEVYNDSARWMERGATPLKLFRNIYKQVAATAFKRHYSGNAHLGYPQFEKRTENTICGHVKDVIIPHEEQINPAHYDELIEMRKCFVTKKGVPKYDDISIAFYMKHHIFYTASMITNKLKNIKTESHAIAVPQNGDLTQIIDNKDDDFHSFDTFKDDDFHSFDTFNDDTFAVRDI